MSELFKVRKSWDRVKQAKRMEAYKRPKQARVKVIRPEKKEYLVLCVIEGGKK